MVKIITFANQKGGSGKSTLSANLAVLWSNSKYKVATYNLVDYRWKPTDENQEELPF